MKRRQRTAFNEPMHIFPDKMPVQNKRVDEPRGLKTPSKTIRPPQLTTLKMCGKKHAEHTNSEADRKKTNDPPMYSTGQMHKH